MATPTLQIPSGTQTAPNGATNSSREQGLLTTKDKEMKVDTKALDATATITLTVSVCGRYASHADALEDLKKEVETLLKKNDLSDFVLEKTEYEVCEWND